ALGALLAVHAMGTGVMLATFIHTGGITGAELGVAAATAFLNQKVLAALFGEAAMAELVTHARQRLDEALSTTFDEERQRYDELLPASGVLTDVAADLRAAGGDLPAPPPRRRRRPRSAPSPPLPDGVGHGVERRPGADRHGRPATPMSRVIAPGDRGSGDPRPAHGRSTRGAR